MTKIVVQASANSYIELFWFALDVRMTKEDNFFTLPHSLSSSTDRLLPLTWSVLV